MAFFYRELSMQTWQCVAFSVIVHGLIFTIPVMSRMQLDVQPETIEWLISTSLPDEITLIVKETAAYAFSRRMHGD